MTYLPPANGGRVNLTIGGNTAGAGALVSSGTATLVGGNNITLSQNGNAITISGGAGGAAGSNTFGMSNLGNTSGTTGVISGSALRYAFAGGNNVTLSQSLNGSSGTLTISAANQTAQTQSNIQAFYDGANSISTGTIRLSNANGVSFGINGQTLTASHNAITSQTNQTMGFYATGNTTQSSSTVLDARSLTFNGLGGVSVGYSNGSVQISGATGGGGGGGGIALANSETTYTSGTANLIEGGGAITINSTTGQSFKFSVPQTSSLSATGAVSISTNGSTISIGVNTANSMDFYQNMDRGTSAALAVPFNSTGGATLMLQRLNQENDEFGANITANTVLLNMSGSLTATSASTGAHTMTAYIGIYADNTTALNLINSASTSWGISANSNNSASYHGVRWLSFVSSQWSAAPTFAQGSEYVFGVFIRATNVAVPMSYIGQNYMMSNQRSGSLGAPTVNSTTLAQGNYWNAIYSASSSAFPTAISSNQVNRNNASAIFMPHIVLNNRYSGTF